jgi:diguanylate cyclase (GGDEF)-like protein
LDAREAFKNFEYGFTAPNGEAIQVRISGMPTVRKGESAYALCYADLDDFKTVNDTEGHPAGDALLSQLGELLPTYVRKRDTVARVGGDEFCFLMEHCTLEQAKRAAENIRETICAHRFEWEGKEFRVGVSIGLMPITPDSETVADLLKVADSACYAAKSAGRGRLFVAGEGIDELTSRGQEMPLTAPGHATIACG